MRNAGGPRRIVSRRAGLRLIVAGGLAVLLAAPAVPHWQLVDNPKMPSQAQINAAQNRVKQ